MDKNLLQTLITALAIIIATLTIWKQYWITLYQIYDKDNHNPRTGAHNKYWIVSLVSALLSWAIFSGIIGLIIFILLAFTELESYWFFIAIGIGLSIFTLLILLFTVLISAWPTWIKARLNQRWGTLNTAYINTIKPYSKCYVIRKLPIFKDYNLHRLLITNDNEIIAKAVNNAGKFTVLLLILILTFSLIFAVCIEFC
jgi:hypothetical protein